MATVQPRDWHELAPIEIDGRAMDSYYQWLALAYAATLAGHPSISIPCGSDAEGLPFGLQIVGRRHEDLRLLSIAKAVESAISKERSFEMRRPDHAFLAAASPLSRADGFFDLA